MHSQRPSLFLHMREWVRSVQYGVCVVGTSLVWTRSKEYLLKHYKPVLKELTSVARVEGSYHHLWISFQERSEIVESRCSYKDNVHTSSCQFPIPFVPVPRIH